jgi:acetoin utilization deacetylase AcuC-like enzyme
LIPEQLIYEGTIRDNQVYYPGLVSDEILLLTHCADYVRRFQSGELTAAEIRRSGFPWSQELVKREYLITSGTIEAMKRAQQDRIAFNGAGGTHHAFRDAGEGFCLFNDFAVAANYWLSLYPNQRILIVDLDVHQGNGTASILNQESRVFTFSMHGRNNFPHRKEHSSLDIALENGIENHDYLTLLERNLDRVMHDFLPDQMLYLAGVDVLKTDRLGKLGLSREGCRERDSMVFQFALKARIPVTVSLGGGYSPKVIDIVEAHCNTIRVASSLFF